MKRFFLLLMVFAGMLASCDKLGGGSSSLVGTWDVVEEVLDYGGEYEDVTPDSPSYYVFTETSMTVYDEEDLMSGVAVDYKYTNGYIKLMGIQFYKVESLTDSQMTLRVVEDNGDGSQTVIKLRKR